MKEESFAEALATKFRTHEQVFEVEAGFCKEGGVVEEIKGETGGRAVSCESEDASGSGARGGVSGKKSSTECLGGSDDFMREFFVVGEAVDELQDYGYICSGGGTDRGRHKLRAKMKSKIWKEKGSETRLSLVCCKRAGFC